MKNPSIFKKEIMGLNFSWSIGTGFSGEHCGPKASCLVDTSINREKKMGTKLVWFNYVLQQYFCSFVLEIKKIYNFIKKFFLKFKMFYQSLVIVATASEVRYDCCMFILVPMVLVYIVHKSSVQNFHKSSVQNFVQSLHVLKSKVSFYLNSNIATILGLAKVLSSSLALYRRVLA